MINPKISIITICYNAVCTIEKTILSVLDQTYDNIEYIVVDGGSIDGTLEVIKKYSSKISIYISEPDKGIYDAMNKGIKLATGEWIHFRNCGDYFYDKDVLYGLFSKNSFDVDIITGDCIWYNSWGERYDTPMMFMLSYKKSMPLFHPSTFVRSHLQKGYLFDLKYRSSADYDLFYKLFASNCSISYHHKPISRINCEGYSTITYWKVGYFENCKIQGLKSWLSIYCNFIKGSLRDYIKYKLDKYIPSFHNYRIKKMIRAGWTPYNSIYKQ